MSAVIWDVEKEIEVGYIGTFFTEPYVGIQHIRIDENARNRGYETLTLALIKLWLLAEGIRRFVHGS